jgi:hypothetical protein
MMPASTAGMVEMTTMARRMRLEIRAEQQEDHDDGDHEADAESIAKAG